MSRLMVATVDPVTGEVISKPWIPGPVNPYPPGAVCEDEDDDLDPEEEGLYPDADGHFGIEHDH